MKLNISIAFTVCLVLSISFSSCLKEKYDSGRIQPTHTDDPIKVVELGLTATSNENFYLLAVDNSDNDTTVNFIPVRLGIAAASQDVHVTVVIEQPLLDAYNTEHGTVYEVPPSDKYTFLNPVVTIPAGSNIGYLKIKFKPSDLLGNDYAFGLRVGLIQEPGYVASGNFGTGVAAVVIKNEYDGLYHAVGHFTHPNPDLTGDYDSEWEMGTSGATSVTASLNTTAAFSASIKYTVDPVTNLVTVSSNDVVLDPIVAADNYYDPLTRTYHFDYTYSGGSRHNEGTATYTGPR